MTVSAHNGRRVYRGASLARNVSPGESPAASMFYELNPHLKKLRKPSAFEVLDQIKPWLLEHGPATAREIAAGLGIAEPSQVNDQIRRGRIRGVVDAGKRLVGNRYFKVYKVEDDEQS